MKKFLLVILAVLFMATGCNSLPESIFSAGVSKELAVYRKSLIKNLEYKLRFDIPADKDVNISARTEISFTLNKREKILLDFKAEPDENLSLKVNDIGIDPVITNEHLIIDADYLKKGENTIVIEFIAPDLSLNRRDNLLYTLLVPDRARTLFPCFDQPDLKAHYSLTLSLPKGWKALANGSLQRVDTLNNGMLLLDFNRTDPLPTYLFSFVAGELSVVTAKSGDRVINGYHQESDSLKLKQWKEIADQIFYSLDWLEEFTAIKYPFEKYDIAIIPGFQYGGMEHTGATLYSDRTMFLEKGATINEHLDRAKLIAHETAHMWFGDYVTMPWFDDVWTKEVFANWFASQIVSPQFPEIDHQVNFVNAYYPSSYSEDRTSGSNAIQQYLDNLNNAGLVYGSIIYNKAPIVMEKLVRKIGYEPFREGIREYLKKYAYSNASWDNLIEILDKLSQEDLKSWSRVWVGERGRPVIRAIREKDSITYLQSDPFERGITWLQDIKSDSLLVNTDGMGYGLFVVSKEDAAAIFRLISEGQITSDITRLSQIINLYENMEEGYISPDLFLGGALTSLAIEKNNLIFSRLLNYISMTVKRYIVRDKKTEDVLWAMVLNEDSVQRKMQLYRVFADIASSPEKTENLYRIWETSGKYIGISLGERDMMKLSYELNLRLPEKANEIYNRQLGFMKSEQRREEFKYIFPSTSADKSIRDSVFNSFNNELNRGIEPWTASALEYLNHNLRSAESIEYIEPALELLGEIQSTGDIFFPANWLKALLGYHNSTHAREIIETFLIKNSDLNPLLISKIKQQSHHMFRYEKDFRSE